MTVKVVKPIPITEAVLTASSIPEPDASVGEVEFNQDASTAISFQSILNTAIDAASDGNIYVLDSFDFYSSGSSYVREYDSSGSPTGLYFDVTSLSKCIEVKSDDIYIGSSAGYVYRYSKVGLQIQIYDLTETLSNCSGICFGADKFYVLDQLAGKIFSFASSFSSPQEIKSFGSSYPFNFGLSYNDGLIYYTSQSEMKIKSITVNGTDSDSFPITNERGGVYYFGGVFFDGSDLMSINNDKKKAYRYKQGVLTQPYQPGERAILTSTHKLYQCVKATNISPEFGATGDETETWVEVGATNKFASFDERLSYPAQITGTKSFELTLADRVNTVAFLNISGITSVRVQMEVGGSIVYDTTKDGLDTSLIYDHYTWWFGDIELVSELIFDDLPPYPTSKLIIDVTGEGGLGQIVTGFAKVIGECLAESSSNTIDLSTQEFDAFGNQKYVPKPIIKLNKYEILSDKSIAPAVERLFRELSGKNALWIGEIGSGQLLTTYGYTERSPIPYNMPTAINYSVTIRGSA